MDFGKLPSVHGVDFALPALSARSREWLARRRKPGDQLRILVGCPVWAERGWTGSVYPKGAKPPEFLSLYTGQFDTIELNSTHYQMPDDAQIAHWRAQAREGFRFCPKFPQNVSHAPELGPVLRLAQLFRDQVTRLGDRLGLSFFQLPPTFGISRLSELQAFLAAMLEERPIPLAVELRHPSWFDPRTRALKDRAAATFELLDIATVITDVAGRRDVCHGSLTAPRAMLRFVGNGGEALDPTDLTRLDAWADRIAEYGQAGLTELYFMAHEPDNLLAPALIHELAPRLESRGLSCRSWQPASHLPGAQMGLFG